MKIRQTNVNLVYPKIDDYRQKFIKFEDSLKDYFLPANLFTVPDEIQSEVPRGVAQTKNGHSFLNIALTVSSFSTIYDNEYVGDWSLCEKYIEERCNKVFDFIERITNEDCYYVGLISNIEYDDFSEDSLQLMKSVLLKDGARYLGDLDDVACKLTYVINNKYYINITLNNMKRYKIMKTKDGRQLIQNGIGGLIGITLDINDRYAANSDESYRSNKATFKEILDIASTVIYKLPDLITKGVFDANVKK